MQQSKSLAHVDDAHIYSKKKKAKQIAKKKMEKCHLICIQAQAQPRYQVIENGAKIFISPFAMPSNMVTTVIRFGVNDSN